MTDSPTPSDFDKQRELFDLAMELPAAEREAFVRREAGDDEALRDGVCALLRQAAASTAALIPSMTTDGLPVAFPFRIDQYEIVGELGRGAMGVVYDARDAGGSRALALKVMQQVGDVNPEQVERFRREARLAASIVHPRVVLIVHADLARGQPYIVMEKVGGVDLQRRVQADGPRSIGSCVELLLDVLDGLIAAHTAGVLHRDIKPSNLIENDDGRAMLTDFGLSRTLQPDVDSSQALDLTQSGAFVGTPHFASPEQLRGEPIDAGSDLYSVAATAYFLLTGQAPFPGKSIAEIGRILSTPAPSVRELRPDVPLELAAWIARGLSKSPADRWTDARAMRAELATLLPRTWRQPTVTRLSSALNIDYSLTVAILWPAAWWCGYFWSGPAWIVEALVLATMLTWCESRYGQTLGKRVFGILVRDVRTGGRPTAWQAFARACLVGLPAYVAATWYWDPLLGSWPDVPVTQLWLALGIAVGAVIGTWRLPGRGVTALELWTGTRSILLEHAKSASDPPVSAVPEGAVHSVGPYVLPEEQPTGQASFLPGWEPGLGRPVYLLSVPDGMTVTLPKARLTGDRPTRLRYLASGRDEIGTWFSFHRPSSSVASLTDGKSPHRPVQFLRLLAAELESAAQEGSLPSGLELAHVHRHADGSPLLLDWPVGSIAAPQAANGDDALAVLREIVVAANTDGRSTFDGDVMAAVQQPTLASACQALERLNFEQVPIQTRARLLVASYMTMFWVLATVAILAVLMPGWSLKHRARAERDLGALREAQRLVIDEERWQEVGAQPERVALLGALAAELELAADRLGTGSRFGDWVTDRFAASQWTNQAPYPANRRAAAEAVLSRLADRPGEVRSLMRFHSLEAARPSLLPILMVGAVFIWLVGVVMISVLIPMAARTGVAAIQGTNPKARLARRHLRQAVAALPVLVVCLYAVTQLPFGIQVLQVRPLDPWLLAGICGAVTFALHWPWSRRMPVDRWIGTDFVLR